jgi:phosphoglucomutase
LHRNRPSVRIFLRCQSNHSTCQHTNSRGSPHRANLLTDIPASSPPTTRPPRPGQTRRSAWRSGLPVTAAPRSNGSFNEHHILAIAQAICEARAPPASDGPLMMGMDTHALSEPARDTALEVFAANDVEVWVDHELGYSPTPVVSHAILRFNAQRRSDQADGVVITPSHNPPEDGGFKYNPPTGGPADSSTTRAIERGPTRFSRARLRDVRRVCRQRALAADPTGATISGTPTWPISARSSTWRDRRIGRSAHRRRPDGRRRARVLGRHR